LQKGMCAKTRLGGGKKRVKKGLNIEGITTCPYVGNVRKMGEIGEEGGLGLLETQEKKMSVN